MRTSGIRQITVGVGHLRRQIGFYGSHLGLKVLAKGRVPAELARELWGAEGSIDMVTIGRPTLPEEATLRLVRASDLPARPDFDPTVPGPLGITFATSDIRRLYYRLSGAGVEFHSPPIELSAGDASAAVRLRSSVYGRASDGEYLILDQTGDEPDGTIAPYFGVTEPRELSLVVPHLAPAIAFAENVFGFQLLAREPRAGSAHEQALSLAPDTRFEVAVLGHPSAPGARLSLYRFGGGTLEAVRPPARGLAALRILCADLDESLAAAETNGGLHLGGPIEVDSPVLGRGRLATVIAPLGLLVELWQPATIE